MNFYTHQHKHYCGSDLHARSMYIGTLAQAGTKLGHKNVAATPEAFLRLIAPYRDALVVAVACSLSWYWLAELCAREGSAFVLGPALSLKARHGGKARNDKIDSHKIAVLRRGGRSPRAYVYPPAMRAPRALLRRRCPLRRKRAQGRAPLQTHRALRQTPGCGRALCPPHRQGPRRAELLPSAGRPGQWPDSRASHCV